MVQEKTEERRSAIRAKRVMSVEYRLVKSSTKKKDKKIYLSTTQDMSVGGVSFYTENEYRTGDVLEIRIVMSGVLDIYTGQGKVVRVEKKKTGSYYLVGIKFLNGHSSSRKAQTYHPRKKTPLKSKKRI